jgi:iron complex outermembrane receptor protein
MARLQRNLQSGWKMTATGSVHQVKTDDRSSFPWGCGKNDNGSYTLLVGAYFCSDGTFSMSDYRSLDEVRTSTQAAIDLQRQFVLIGDKHTIGFSAEAFNRLMTQPSYSWASGVGEGSVYDATLSYSPGASFNDAFRQDILTSSIAFSDRIQTAGQHTIALQSRWIRYQSAYRSEYPYYNAYSWNTSADYKILSSISWSKNYGQQSLFASYRQDLEAGAKAPFESTNNGQVMPARVLESAEAGLKRKYGELSVSGVVFYSWRSYNFRDDPPLSPTAVTGSYIQRGTESRTGLELSLSGALTKRTDAQISATLMTSDTSGTGNSLFEGKEALNTPKFRLNTFVNYRVPGIEGLSASANWLYTGKRPASRDNSVYAPDFHRLDLGLSYAQKTKAGATTYRLAIENVTDERYWRDVAEFLGDAYLTPGAPRLVKASATVSF